MCLYKNVDFSLKFLWHERSIYLPVGWQHSQWGVICPAVSDWSEVLQAGVWALLQSGKQHYCDHPLNPFIVGCQTLRIPA